MREELKKKNEFAEKVEDYHAMAEAQLTRIKNTHFDELWLIQQLTYFFLTSKKLLQIN